VRKYLIKLSKQIGIHRYLTKVYPYWIEVAVPTFFLYRLKLNFWLHEHGFLQSRFFPNKLPQELIISLTSYPARFDMLHLTLKCLLIQSFSYDRIVLWISYEDEKLLPSSVLDLKEKGLEINFCENLRSFKKIIPALEKYPNAYIVTADDDVFYDRNWLFDLIDNHKVGVKEIIGHRAHFINLNDHNYPLSYSKWGWGKGLVTPSLNNFLTGIGGILYPPNTLYKDVKNVDLFMELTPKADDVWLYWMARLNNTQIRKASAKKRKFWCWPSTQTTSLLSLNVDEGGNDKQIEAINKKYELFKSN
jgi:protein O-GlcNAc transferase